MVFLLLLMSTSINAIPGTDSCQDSSRRLTNIISLILCQLCIFRHSGPSYQILPWFCCSGKYEGAVGY